MGSFFRSYNMSLGVIAFVFGNQKNGKCFNTCWNDCALFRRSNMFSIRCYIFDKKSSPHIAVEVLSVFAFC